MTDDMVKKSADIPKEDDEWLEESHINFSKFVRRKIAEKRANSIKDRVKQDLYQDVEKVIQIGKELREEWDNFEEELEEEHDAEITLKENHVFGFEIEGEDKSYSSDWAGNEILKDGGQLDEEDSKAKEFGSKYGGKWQNILGDFVDRVEEETSFNQVDYTPLGNTFEGKFGFNTFTLQTTNLPTSRSSVDVNFESRVHIKIQDLENAVEN